MPAIIFIQIEVYQEVLTTTLPGFISQLGGQSGLFVGLSVCSIVQIGISLAWKCHRWYEANNWKWKKVKQTKPRGRKRRFGGGRRSRR
jgi:hypothetical protein